MVANNRSSDAIIPMHRWSLHSALIYSVHCTAEVQSVFAALFIAVQLVSKLICSVPLPSPVRAKHFRTAHRVKCTVRSRNIPIAFTLHCINLQARLLSTRQLTLSEHCSNKVNGLQWTILALAVLLTTFKAPVEMSGRLHDIFLFCCFDIFLCRRFMTFFCVRAVWRLSCVTKLKLFDCPHIFTVHSSLGWFFYPLQSRGKAPETLHVVCLLIK